MYVQLDVNDVNDLSACAELVSGHMIKMAARMAEQGESTV